MIISHPILGPIKQDDFSFAALVKDTGTYPVTPSQMWHGGAHIAVNGTSGVEVRAIADGTVIAYRVPTVKPTDAKLLESHPLNYRGWSDDGFVLLKHEKESGTDTKVVFYSLYMHLSALAKRLKGKPGEVQLPVADDNQIKRKHLLGVLGSVYNKSHNMHFEIITDETNLNAFFKRGKSDHIVDGQGRGEADLWGDVHFVIPQGTVYYTQEPDPSKPDNLSARICTTHATLCVSVAYSRTVSNTATAANANGNRLLTTYLESGEQIGQRNDPGFEYNIYKLAQKRFPQHTSAGYELIRFGRVFGPDSLLADATNWQHLPLGYGRQGWVDINQPAIKKLSDADFPYWHWRRIEEPAATAYDGKCEPATLLSLLDGNHDNTLAPLEFARFVRDEQSRKKLSYTICKFPSEWDASDFDQHWGWLKSYFKNAASRDKELAESNKAWAEKRKENYAKALPEFEAAVKHIEGVKKELVEQKAALLNEKATLTTQRTELAAKLALEQKTQAKQQASKNTKLEDMDQTKLAVANTEAEIHCAQTRQLEVDQGITGVDANMADAESAFTLSQMNLESIQQNIKNIPDEITATEAEIKRQDESLKQTPPKDPEQPWNEFKAHVTALQFWDKVPGLPNAKEIWHFHPVAFVEHFKKCHWLSKDELSDIYPKGFDEVGVLPLPEARERYRKDLNKITYKYGVTSKTKMSHFFGQGAVESFSLQFMVEPSNAPYRQASLADETNGFYSDPRDFYYTHVQFYDRKQDNIEKEVLLDSKGKPVTISGDKDAKKEAAKTIDRSISKAGDGQKFRGRGMKQLTGRYNYAHYYVYRGWLRKDSFDSVWWPASPTKRPPIINDPQRISVDSFNCIDAGGWFWEAGSAQTKFKTINSAITEGDVSVPAIRSVTNKINGGENNLDKRIEHTQRIYKLLGDA